MHFWEMTSYALTVFCVLKLITTRSTAWLFVLMFLGTADFLFIYGHKKQAEAEKKKKEQEAIARAMRDLHEYEARQEREARQLEIMHHRQAFREALIAIPTVEVEETLNTKSTRRKMDDFPVLTTGRITAKSDPEKLKNFVAIDTETTGLDPEKDRVLEISAIRFEDGQPVSRWTSLVNPRKKIPAKATEINGIDDEMVADEPVMSQIADSLAEFLSASPAIVGHKISFDFSMLWADGIDFPEGVKIYDTLKLSRQAFPELSSHTLSSVALHCGHYIDGAHRSAADAYAAGLVFLACVRDLTRKEEPEEPEASE